MNPNCIASIGVDRVAFDAFYNENIPVVYGYLLRLCGGDREQAWDLTQETWVILVENLADGRIETKTTAYLLTVARSRYLDFWRRKKTLQRKLALVWAAARDSAPEQLSTSQVLEHISACSHQHRVVLMLAYVDDIPVKEIAEMLGSSLSSTYALLARARRELRTHLTGEPQ